MVDAKLITEKIIEALAQEEQFSEIVLKKDVTIEGRTADYPVDLYLEFFSDNGVQYKIIINTKTAANVLTKSELFSFANILNDISGQVVGVIFTQPVYDMTVHNMADDVGIMIYELHDFAEELLWEPNVVNMKVEVDNEWADAEKAKYGLENDKIKAGGDPKYMFLYDDAGICVDSVDGIFKEYIKRQYQKDDFNTVNIRHEFDEKNVYLLTEHPLITKVKLKALTFTIVFRQIGQLDGREMLIDILSFSVVGKRSRR